MEWRPLKAIRRKCLDCCCNNPYEVRMCELTSCALHQYRSGHRPKSMTDEAPELPEVNDWDIPGESTEE